MGKQNHQNSYEENIIKLVLINYREGRGHAGCMLVTLLTYSYAKSIGVIARGLFN